MTDPNPAQRRDWFSSNFERVPADYDPTDAEQGGLAAAWAESRAHTKTNDAEQEPSA